MGAMLRVCLLVGMRWVPGCLDVCTLQLLAASPPQGTAFFFYQQHTNGMLYTCLQTRRLVRSPALPALLCAAYLVCGGLWVAAHGGISALPARLSPPSLAAAASGLMTAPPWLAGPAAAAAAGAAAWWPDLAAVGALFHNPALGAASWMHLLLLDWWAAR